MSGVSGAGRGGGNAGGKGGSANQGGTAGTPVAGSGGRSGGSGGSAAGGGGRTGGGSGAGGSGAAVGGGTSGGDGGGSGGSSASTGGGGTSGGGTSGGGTSGGGSGGSAGGSSNCVATGFHVKDGVLYDVKCNEFVMRGVNYPYTWFATRNTQQDLGAIAATGANAVRIVLSSGGRWTRTTGSTLTSILGWAKAAKLVSIVEVHDTTGYSEQSGSVALSNATSYWTSSDIAAALLGQEPYVIVNVGNEPNGNNTSNSWVSSHVTAVEALRNSGYEHTLMVDAPNWGQDWENSMRDGGGVPIWQADASKNIVFSVHMYDVYGSSSTISSYFNGFLSAYDAPLVVGEFAADHGDSGNVDEDTIMSLAENLSIGYLGWSWAGNSG
ncbi:MAG TPA: cellulase family glycosylhydrolase, partial [Polyangiaceae bacterium]